MTALFVIQFLSLLWAAGLSVWLAVVAGQCRDTRRSVLAEFKDKPNPLHLPLRPVSVADAARITGQNATLTPPRGVLAARAVRGPDDLVAHANVRNPAGIQSPARSTTGSSTC